MKRLLPLVCLSLCCAVSTRAMTADAPFDADTLDAAIELRDEALRRNDAYSIVASLSQDVGARAAGSEGDRKAVIWAQQMLRERGFVNVRAEPVTVPHWVRGDIRVGFAGEAAFTALALGGSVGTPDGAVEAPVLRVNDLDELQALDAAQVQGRIVFIDQRLPRTRDGSGYGQTVRNRGMGPQLAAERGARAVLIRSVGTSAHDVAHTGTTFSKGRLAPIPAAALSNPHADALALALQQAPERPLSLWLGSHWAADEVSANVIGEIPGAVDEWIVLAAHLDSWDVGQGANDDGAGVAIVSEAARLVGRRLPLHRGLRVVLYANEEFGLSGAKTYAASYAEALAQHALAMEADFGSAAVWRLDSRVTDAALPAVAAIAEVLAPLGVAAGGNQAFGGADIGPLMAAGVPVLGPVQDGSAYFDVHHSHDDTLDAIDRQGLSQNVAVYAVSAWLASQYSPGFGRLPLAAATP